MATENYLLSVQGVQATSYNECVLCFQSTGLSSTDTLDAAADLCSAFIGHGLAFWLACLPGSYQCLKLAARRAFPKPSATAYRQFQQFAQTGTSGAFATADNLCPSIFLVPPMGTKSGGRVFMPSIAQGDISNNSYTAGYLTALGAFFNAAITGFAGSGTSWKLAIYSRKNASAALALGFTPSARVGFQGRRRSPSGAV